MIEVQKQGKKGIEKIYNMKIVTVNIRALGGTTKIHI